jgi:hypothetical protein
MCREINKEIKMPKMKCADGSYINVAPIIEHPHAYAEATKARIIANAQKTFCRTYADHDEIQNFLCAGRVHDDEGNFKHYKEGFIGSLASAFDSYGKLSEKQVLAVRKCIADRNARKAEWANNSILAILVKKLQ